MDLLQKDVPILAKIYEAKCFYDSQNNRIILYYKNHVTARTLVDFYNLPETPPPNSSLYVIYDLQTGTFNVSTDPPTYTVSNSKVYVTSPINAEYDMDKVIIYKINSWCETDTNIDLNYILTQLNTFVRKQQADTITATHTFDPTEPGPAFQLGPNAQNQLIQYLNADKVDGFDASQTPAPNTIPVTLSTGKLDLNWIPASQTPAPNTIPVALSTGKLDLGWLPDACVYRRINLTNATIDYDLQPGEEAYYVWDTTVSTSLPLRIKVSGMLYEMIAVVPNRNTNAIYLALAPNNTTYSSAFRRTVLYPAYDSASAYNWKDAPSSIFYEQVGGGGMLISWLQTTTTNKGEMHHITIQHSGVLYSQHMQIAHRWNDTTTVWSSLGTLVIGAPNGVIYVSVRRLV